MHSRYRVRWNDTPKKPVKIAKWADNICSQTLDDMHTGDALAENGDLRIVYVRILYEDLVRSPLAVATRVYGLIGVPVPTSVVSFFNKVVPGASSEGDSQADRPADKGIGNTRRRQLWADARASAAAAPLGELVRGWRARWRRLSQEFGINTKKSQAQFVGGWKSTLSLEAIAAIESNPKCRSMMAQLNYSLTRP